MEAFKKVGHEKMTYLQLDVHVESMSNIVSCHTGTRLQ